MKHSIIAGATGLVGNNILHQLAVRGDTPVAMARRPIKDLPANAQLLEINFEQFLINGELPQCDHLYLCLGTTIKTAGSRDAFRAVDFEYSLAVAKKAIQAGATGISLVSSVGADASSKNFYLKTKGQLEDAIKSLGFSSINIYRPGILMGDRSETRPLEGLGKIVFQVIDPLLLGYLSPYRSIQANLLASTMIDNADQFKGINYFYFKDFNTN
ncbi:MAG: NAD(P)H-binding protein [Porticoccaceae bacterium]|nr:NAD(P)H-binding protein [Porticoccaceae bacterium]